jgi:hypothetical protein
MRAVLSGAALLLVTAGALWVLSRAYLAASG